MPESSAKDWRIHWEALGLGQGLGLVHGDLAGSLGHQMVTLVTFGPHGTPHRDSDSSDGSDVWLRWHSSISSMASFAWAELCWPTATVPRLQFFERSIAVVFCSKMAGHLQE